MFKLKRWLALLAIGIMGGIASFAGTAKATSVSHVIDLDHLRSDDVTNTAPKFHLETNPSVTKAHHASVKFYGGSDHHKVTNATGTMAKYGNVYHCAGAQKIVFSYVGTYKGVGDVGAVVEVFNTISMKFFNCGDTLGAGFALVGNGSGNRGPELDFKITLVKANTQQSIGTIDNSYITFGSLNAYEGNNRDYKNSNYSEWFGAYGNRVYVAQKDGKQNVVDFPQHAGVVGRKINGQYPIGWKDDPSDVTNNFVYSGGTVDFHNGMSFALGTYNMNSTWMSPLSVPIKTYVAAPKKTVDCKDGDKQGWHNADGTNVREGQNVAFMLEEKMPQASVDILKTYNQVKFWDNIDKAFEVTSIEVDNCSSADYKNSLSNGTGTISAKDWKAKVTKNSDGSSHVEIDMQNLNWAGFYNGRSFKAHINTKVRHGASLGKHENIGHVTVNGYDQSTNKVGVNVIKTNIPSPEKSASVSQVSFDGKEFTYDVKQQVNKFNTDIFDKYSQMSFDDKVPDSLQVTDVQILKDGTDVTGQVGSVYGRNGRGFYNNERNHVHCDFSSVYLDKMSLDGETYTMRIHVKYTAHKLQSQETEIKNSAEVRINNDGKTASATVKVPETWYHDDKFKKTSNRSTFDSTKDEIIRYTLKAQYGNEWHPWGSSFKDNMPDNATLDTNSIKVTYYDPMTGEHQNLNVNDYFTNKSDSKHLELVLNKDKDGKSGSTDKFINSQVTVTYDMTIHGNSYWSGGYSDKPGTKYYNAGTGKITVPNIATWKGNQDDNAPVLTSEADVTTDARPSSLQKSAAQSTFDYSKEQTLSYTLTAKFGNLTYPKGAVLRDVIPENCTLDTNSIRMKLTDPSGKMSDIKTSDYFTDKSDSKRIELLMNKNMQESSMRMFINSKLTVTYNMKISGNADWSDYYNSTAHRIDVPNTATFTDSESPDKTTHSSTATITTQCQEPSITAYIAQDNGNFMQGTKKVHYSRNSTDSSEKAVTTAYKVVVGNYRKVSVLSVLAASPEGFDISRVVTRNSISNNAEAKSQDYTGTGLALSASGNSARAEKTNAQSLVGKSFTMIVKTAPTVRNWQKYAKLAGNTGSYRAGLSLTYRSSGGADGKSIYANTVSATVPNVYEYKPLASVKTADGKLKYYGKLSGLAVSASNPTTFTSNAVTLNGSSVALPGGIKTSQSQNIVTSLNAANKAEVKANNDLENADRAVIVTDSKLNAGESDTGIKTDFTPMNSGKITKANTLYLNSYGQINYYDYDNGKISRKVLNEAYVFSAKFDEPQAKGGYGIYNPNSFKAVCYNDFADIADKFATVFTDRDGLTDAGYIAKHGNVYTEKLDFTSKTGNADISNIDTVLGKTTLNAADRNRNLKQTVLGTTGADETDHALKQARENELHLTPQAHYLNLDYRFNHRGLTNGKQFLVKADNRYPAYNTSQTFDSGYDGGHRLYLRDWLRDGSYRTNYSCNGFGSLNRMSLNVDQSIRIYGRRYLSKEHGFNTGGEISVQPAMSDKDYNIKGGSQSLQNWLGNY